MTQNEEAGDSNDSHEARHTVSESTFSVIIMLILPFLVEAFDGVINGAFDQIRLLFSGGAA